MKNKNLIALVLTLALAFSLAGCGGSGKVSEAAPASGYSYSGAYADYDMVYAEEAAYETEASAPMANAAVSGSTGLGGTETGNTAEPQNMSEKIIYNGDVTLETTSFDDTLTALNEMVASMGGYMESTSVSGTNYDSASRGYRSSRNAYYTIRIPAARFNELMGTLTTLGNVPRSSTSSQNITTKYYDTQSRLNAYRVQETRLLEMLAIAETVEDMLAIQKELTDVQYQIDSLTGTLRYYDNQVGYSTVDLTVREVFEYTPVPTVKLTYWERMAKGFMESVDGTVTFFTEFFLWFVTSLPWLVPTLIIGYFAVKFLRKRSAARPGREAKRQEKQRQKELRRAEKAAKKAAKKAAGQSDGAPAAPASEDTPDE